MLPEGRPSRAAFSFSAVLLAAALAGSGCAARRAGTAPPGTPAGRQSSSAACPLSSLAPEDWAALTNAARPLSPGGASMLPEAEARRLCLARRLLRLVRQAEDREKFAEELVPEDVPEDLRLNLTAEEFELVRPVAGKLQARFR